MVCRQLRIVTRAHFNSDKPQLRLGIGDQVHTGICLCHQIFFCGLLFPTPEPKMREKWPMAHQRSPWQESTLSTISSSQLPGGTSGHLGVSGALGPSCLQAATGRDAALGLWGDLRSPVTAAAHEKPSPRSPGSASLPIMGACYFLRLP